ncbi:MAG: hypothetical protein ACO3JT_09060 [Candidatus Nanopelagicales bacterium]
MATTTHKETTIMDHDFHGMNSELRGIYYAMNYEIEDLSVMTPELAEMLETIKSIFEIADAAGCVRKYSWDYEATMFLWPQTIGGKTTWIDQTHANYPDGIEISIEDVEEQRANNDAARMDDDLIYVERLLERCGISTQQNA